MFWGRRERVASSCRLRASEMTEMQTGGDGCAVSPAPETGPGQPAPAANCGSDRAMHQLASASDVWRHANDGRTAERHRQPTVMTSCRPPPAPPPLNVSAVHLWPTLTWRPCQVGSASSVPRLAPPAPRQLLRNRDSGTGSGSAGGTVDKITMVINITETGAEVCRVASLLL